MCVCVQFRSSLEIFPTSIPANGYNRQYRIKNQSTSNVNNLMLVSLLELTLSFGKQVIQKERHRKQRKALEK